MPLALQYIGLAIGISIAVILFRAGWEIFIGGPRLNVFCSVQRGRRFRLLHLRTESGQWAFIITPTGGHDAWYWDEPLFPGG